jgi:hypothetical protein
LERSFSALVAKVQHVDGKRDHEEEDDEDRPRRLVPDPVSVCVDPDSCADDGVDGEGDEELRVVRLPDAQAAGSTATWTGSARTPSILIVILQWLLGRMPVWAAL